VAYFGLFLFIGRLFLLRFLFFAHFPFVRDVELLGMIPSFPPEICLFFAST